MLRNMTRIRKAAFTAILAAALLVPTAAFGARDPGGGGGGGGGGGEEIAANNLSVPAIFVGANPFGLTCGVAAVDPTGTPLTGYPIDPDAYYYVQKVHKWQAECITATVGEEVGAMAGWGDNLTGDAKLKAGSPIRVEMGLDAGDEGLDGYVVEKLDPAALDRVAPYGVLADLTVSKQEPYTETRVWDAAGWLKIYPEGSPDSPIVNTAAKAEINSTGRVVYGYNLRVTSPGRYVIEFTFPNVTITGTDGGTIVGHTVSLTVTVGTGGGGGGKPR